MFTPVVFPVFRLAPETSSRPRRRLLGAALLALLGAAPFPGWTQQVCRNDIPATAPDSRFINNGDGTVTDQATGVMWKRCAEGQSGTDCASGGVSDHTWQQALQVAANSTFAGYNDWRLPNIQELSSLTEDACYAPSINLWAFPNTPSPGIWSASSNAAHPYTAWYVWFGHGYVYLNKYDGLFVRLARGGQ